MRAVRPQPVKGAKGFHALPGLPDAACHSVEQRIPAERGTVGLPLEEHEILRELPALVRQAQQAMPRQTAAVGVDDQGAHWVIDP